MCNRTLEIGNYTLKDIHQIIHIYDENGNDIEATDVIETLAQFDDELDSFIRYFSTEQIDEIIKWYFAIGIDDDNTFIQEEKYYRFSTEQIDEIIKWYFAIGIDDDNTLIQEEKYYRNKLKVIKYLKARELEKYIQKIRHLVNLEVFSDDYCRIISREGFLPCYFLQNVESITNFTLISIKKEEFGIVYLFEGEDRLD